MGSDTWPPLRGGTDDDFEEYRIKRPYERPLDPTIEDVAHVDERLGELVGRVA